MIGLVWKRREDRVQAAQAITQEDQRRARWAATGSNDVAITAIQIRSAEGRIRCTTKTKNGELEMAPLGMEETARLSCIKDRLPGQRTDTFAPRSCVLGDLYDAAEYLLRAWQDCCATDIGFLVLVLVLVFGGL